MADYFKFCPKCGRVLDRDWCPHCEPEKEKAFRRQQMRMEDELVEGYSSDQKKGSFLQKAKKVKTDSKAYTSAKAYESGRESRRENRREGKGEFWNEPRRTKTRKSSTSNNSVWKKLIPVLIGVIFATSLPGMLIGGVSRMVDTGSFSGIFDNKNDSFFSQIFSDDEDDVDEVDEVGDTEVPETITDYSFRNLLHNEEYYDFVPDAEYQVVRDKKMGSQNYQYKVKGNSRGYYLSLYNFVETEDGETKATKGVQKTLDKLYASFKAKAENAKKKKLEVTGSLIGYVTYYDDDYANLVINTYESNGPGEKRYSYMVNLDTLEVLPEDKGFMKQSEFYDAIEERLKNYSVKKEAIDKCIKEKNYQICFDADGTVWGSFKIGDYIYKNVKFDYAQFDGDEISY